MEKMGQIWGKLRKTLAGPDIVWEGGELRVIPMPCPDVQDTLPRWCAHGAVGRRALFPTERTLPRGCSGVLATWWLAFFRVTDPREGKRGGTHALALKVMLCTCHHSLVVRSRPLSPDQNQGEGRSLKNLMDGS